MDHFTDANAQASAISSGETQAVAQAIAMAFHNGGSQAQAYAQAISSGIQQHGCNFYQQTFAQVCYLPRVLASVYFDC
jgi:hypothetical protein